MHGQLGRAVARSTGERPLQALGDAGVQLATVAGGIPS
jgi:hypothetical protein